MAENEKLIVLIGTPAGVGFTIEGGNAASVYTLEQVIDGGNA